MIGTYVGAVRAAHFPARGYSGIFPWHTRPEHVNRSGCNLLRPHNYCLFGW
jgi:hypothetical protein